MYRIHAIDIALPEGGRPLAVLRADEAVEIADVVVFRGAGVGVRHRRVVDAEREAAVLRLCPEDRTSAQPEPVIPVRHLRAELQWLALGSRNEAPRQRVGPALAAVFEPLDLDE